MARAPDPGALTHRAGEGTGQEPGMLLFHPMQAVTAATFASLTSHGLVLVDFRADWCHPCSDLVPALNALEAGIPGLVILTVDVDREKDLAKQQGVRAIPALHLYREGRCEAVRVGVGTEAELRQHFHL